MDIFTSIDRDIIAYYHGFHVQISSAWGQKVKRYIVQSIDGKKPAEGYPFTAYGVKGDEENEEIIVFDLDDVALKQLHEYVAGATSDDEETQKNAVRHLTPMDTADRRWSLRYFQDHGAAAHACAKTILYLATRPRYSVEIESCLINPYARARYGLPADQEKFTIQVYSDNIASKASLWLWKRKDHLSPVGAVDPIVLRKLMDIFPDITMVPNSYAAIREIVDAVQRKIHSDLILSEPKAINTTEYLKLVKARPPGQWLCSVHLVPLYAHRRVVIVEGEEYFLSANDIVYLQEFLNRSVPQTYGLLKWLDNEAPVYFDLMSRWQQAAGAEQEHILTRVKAIVREANRPRMYVEEGPRIFIFYADKEAEEALEALAASETMSVGACEALLHKSIVGIFCDTADGVNDVPLSAVLALAKDERCIRYDHICSRESFKGVR